MRTRFLTAFSLLFCLLPGLSLAGKISAGAGKGELLPTPLRISVLEDGHEMVSTEFGVEGGDVERNTDAIFTGTYEAPQSIAPSRGFLQLQGLRVFGVIDRLVRDPLDNSETEVDLPTMQLIPQLSPDVRKIEMSFFREVPSRSYEEITRRIPEAFHPQREAYLKTFTRQEKGTNFYFYTRLRFDDFTKESPEWNADRQSWDYPLAQATDRIPLLPARYWVEITSVGKDLRREMRRKIISTK